jgi:hypothetical protein
MYFSGAPNRALLALRRPDVGVMYNPDSGNILDPDVPTALENGCFAKGAAFDEHAWMRWLAQQPRAGCMFAVAPDVFGDAFATCLRSTPLLGDIKALGFQAAFVLQNGVTDALIPWSLLDCLFVGGDDLFKLGWTARHYVAEARARGKWTHMGRVNSWTRMVQAAQAGYDSVDGTYLKYGPDVNLPRLIRWLDGVNTPAELSA